MRQPIAGLILSNIARAGLTAFLKTLAREVAGDGVTVNSLQPGFHDTERIRSLYGGDLDATQAGIPAGVLGDPDGLRPDRGVPLLGSGVASSPAPPFPSTVVRTRGCSECERVRIRLMGTDGGSRIVTVPNVISLVRLACAPVFVWLLADDELLAAAALLAVLGASDWVDGWIARHFDQGSDLGKVLDPVADRILLLVAAVALIVQGSVPARGRRAGARPGGSS